MLANDDDVVAYGDHVLSRGYYILAYDDNKLVKDD